MICNSQQIHIGAPGPGGAVRGCAALVGRKGLRGDAFAEFGGRFRIESRCGRTHIAQRTGTSVIHFLFSAGIARKAFAPAAGKIKNIRTEGSAILNISREDLDPPRSIEDFVVVEVPGK